MSQFFVQDSNEIIEYQISWASVLPEGVTISSSDWVGTGLTISDEALEGDFTAAFVTGGLKGKRYELENTVVLSNEETYKDTIFIFFEDK
jgi:hypothetical protein